MADGDQLVSLVLARVAPIERVNIDRQTKQGLHRARAEGKLAGSRWSTSRARIRAMQWASISLALRHKAIGEILTTFRRHQSR